MIRCLKDADIENCQIHEALGVGMEIVAYLQMTNIQFACIFKNILKYILNLCLKLH